MSFPRLSPLLLAWFDENRRTLPFRDDPTPYHVWVSEIMLQQTRVSAALPYYERWMRELPAVQDLAACEPDRLHKLWEGLGYYSRVRNLQKAAQIVCSVYGGRIPDDPALLRKLPGIGEYTAGAIASIGFGRAVPAVDGNVLRVFSRLYNDDADISRPAAKRLFTARVTEHLPADRPGDFNQALMELGALVCLPGGAPLCGQCPLQGLCLARRAGTQAALPRKAAPPPRRVQDVTAALVLGPRGWLLQKRPDAGLLAGLYQPLLWEEALSLPEVLRRLQALGVTPRTPPRPAPDARHLFSHLEWRMSAWMLDTDCAADLPAPFLWEPPALEHTALPGAFRSWRPLLLDGEKNFVSRQL